MRKREREIYCLIFQKTIAKTTRKIETEYIIERQSYPGLCEISHEVSYFLPTIILIRSLFTVKLLQLHFQ